MEQPAADPPADEERAITVSVTATGNTADAIRELAAVDGRTPEALTLEWAAGNLVIPDRPIGDDPRAMEILRSAMFDGPRDLAADSVHGPREEG